MMNMYVTILSNLPDSSLPLLQLAQVFRVQGDRWARPIQDLGFSSIEHFVEADVLQPGTWCTDRVHMCALAKHMRKDIVMVYSGTCMCIVTTHVDGMQRFVPWDILLPWYQSLDGPQVRNVLFVRYRGSYGELEGDAPNDHFEYLVPTPVANKQSPTSQSTPGLAAKPQLYEAFCSESLPATQHTHGLQQGVWYSIKSGKRVKHAQPQHATGAHSNTLDDYSDTTSPTAWPPLTSTTVSASPSPENVDNVRHSRPLVPPEPTVYITPTAVKPVTGITRSVHSTTSVPAHGVPPMPTKPSPRPPHIEQDDDALLLDFLLYGYGSPVAHEHGAHPSPTTQPAHVVCMMSMLAQPLLFVRHINALPTANHHLRTPSTHQSRLVTAPLAPPTNTHIMDHHHMLSYRRTFGECCSA